jgi:hypothetical protein
VTQNNILRLPGLAEDIETTVKPVAYLYRHFDGAGVLLYVGVSMKHLERLAQHKANAHWYDRITRIEIERFPTWDALAAEAKAIIDEKPECNILPGVPNPIRRPTQRELENQRQLELQEREDRRLDELRAIAARLRTEWLSSEKSNADLFDQIMRVENMALRRRR